MPIHFANPSKAAETIRQIALAYPDATEAQPWGEIAIKVRNKTFLFMGYSEEKVLGISVKLPHSRGAALELPFCEPTHYGLGKSGWVTAKFGPKDKPPMKLIRAWIDESYRAIAPKTLARQISTK